MTFSRGVMPVCALQHSAISGLRWAAAQQNGIESEGPSLRASAIRFRYAFQRLLKQRGRNHAFVLRVPRVISSSQMQRLKASVTNKLLFYDNRV